MAVPSYCARTSRIAPDTVISQRKSAVKRTCGKRSAFSMQSAGKRSSSLSKQVVLLISSKRSGSGRVRQRLTQSSASFPKRDLFGFPTITQILFNKRRQLLCVMDPWVHVRHIPKLHELDHVFLRVPLTLKTHTDLYRASGPHINFPS